MQQHRVSLLFGLFVRTIGAARFTRAVFPLAALVAAATVPLPPAAPVIDASVVPVSVSRMLAAQGADGDAAMSSSPSRSGEATALQAAAATESNVAPSAQQTAERDGVSPLKLSTEQRNISRFVARRYRTNLSDVQRFVAHAYRAAREFRLDPYLVLAVMSIESSFNPNARSSAGAQGLMQVLTRVHVDKFAPFGGPRAALDPFANVTVGARILKEYLVREGSVEGALKSYVGAALLSHDFGYGSKVLGERARIEAAAKGAAPVPEVRPQPQPVTKLAMAPTRSSPSAVVATSPDSAAPTGDKPIATSPSAQLESSSRDL